MSQPRTMPGISVDYTGDGRSTKSNDMGMRPMQQRVWQFRNEKYLLLKSPWPSRRTSLAALGYFLVRTVDVPNSRLALQP